MTGKEKCPSESSVSMNEALEGIPNEPSAGWIRSVDSQNATGRLSPPCMWLPVPRQWSILELRRSQGCTDTYRHWLSRGLLPPLTIGSECVCRGVTNVPGGAEL